MPGTIHAPRCTTTHARCECICSATRSSVRTCGKSECYTPLFHLQPFISAGSKIQTGPFSPKTPPQPFSPISSAFVGLLVSRIRPRRWLQATLNLPHNNHHHHHHPPNQSLSLESSDVGMQSLSKSLRVVLRQHRNLLQQPRLIISLHQHLQRRPSPLPPPLLSGHLVPRPTPVRKSLRRSRPRQYGGVQSASCRRRIKRH